MKKEKLSRISEPAAEVPILNQSEPMTNNEPEFKIKYLGMEIPSQQKTFSCNKHIIESSASNVVRVKALRFLY